MTKTEFIQQACIAMAGNTKFTKTTYGPQTCNDFIVKSAECLASEVGKVAPFDEFTINEEVTDIRKSVSQIDDKMDAR